MTSTPGRPARLHFDLTTLRLFVAVAELGGVTRAAERLHIAPAAASRRIVDLEAQFGLALFERRPHGMALTDGGRALLAHARAIAHTVSRMQDDAASYVGGDQGVVRVAAPKSVLIQFLPADIRRCAVACPGVRIDLQEMNSALVQQALRRDVADIGIFESTLGAIDLPTLPYRADRLVAVAARGHALADRAVVSLDDIVGCEVIGLGDGSAVALTLERLAAEAGRVLHMRMRVSGFDSMAALVGEGLGLGVMPAAVAASVAAGPRFVHLPIADAWAARQFVLCHRQPAALSRAAQAVAAVLAQAPDTQAANAASPK